MSQSSNSRPLLGALPVLAASLILAACAVNPADAQSSTAGRVAQAREACARTMGLSPADIDYDMCVSSLLQTVAGLDQVALVERDRRACMARGLVPNTREFALCVVDAEPTVSN
jgi:hypothetical protein